MEYGSQHESTFLVAHSCRFLLSRSPFFLRRLVLSPDLSAAVSTPLLLAISAGWFNDSLFNAHPSSLSMVMDTLKPDRGRPRFLTRLVFPAGGNWSYRGSTSERASGGDSIVYGCSRARSTAARCLRSDPRGERRAKEETRTLKFQLRNPFVTWPRIFQRLFHRPKSCTRTRELSAMIDRSCHLLSIFA